MAECQCLCVASHIGESACMGSAGADYDVTLQIEGSLLAQCQPDVRNVRVPMCRPCAWAACSIHPRCVAMRYITSRP